jgi:hypothetical protein
MRCVKMLRPWSEIEVQFKDGLLIGNGASIAID